MFVVTGLFIAQYKFRFNHLPSDAYLNRSVESVKKASHLRTMDQLKRQPIRIYFDTTQLEANYNDTYKCSFPNEKIKWNNNEFTCRNEDILEEEHISAIKGTAENVKNYLSKLIYIDERKESIKLKNLENIGYKKGEGNNVDIYISLVPRPFKKSGAIASTFIANRDEKNFSIQAFIAINPEYAPTEPESESSNSVLFYVTLLHETLHALGLQYEDIKYWKDKNGNPYKNTICEMTIATVKRLVLITPAANMFAKRHFGVDKFNDGTIECPAGITLEDGGSNGTSLKHPESRTFFSDIMIGEVVSDKFMFERVTEVTLAMLIDTGRYDVNWSMGYPLICGRGQSIRGEKLKQFPTGVPSKVYPSNYLYNREPYNYEDIDSELKYYTSPGFDFTFTGYNYGFEIPDDADFYFKGIDFFNPENHSLVGGWIYDFQRFTMPSEEKCQIGSAAIPTNKNAFCAPYKCYGFDKFTFTVNGTVYTCTKHDEVIMVDNLTVKCPAPQQFCRTLWFRGKHFESDPFSDDYKEMVPIPENIEPSDELSDGEIAAIVVCIVIVLIIAIVVGWYCFCRKTTTEYSNQIDAVSNDPQI